MPVYNERRTLPQVLESIRAVPIPKEILTSPGWTA